MVPLLRKFHGAGPEPAAAVATGEDQKQVRLVTRQKTAIDPGA